MIFRRAVSWLRYAVAGLARAEFTQTDTRMKAPTKQRVMNQ